MEFKNVLKWFYSNGIRYFEFILYVKAENYIVYNGIITYYEYFIHFSIVLTTKYINVDNKRILSVYVVLYIYIDA